MAEKVPNGAPQARQREPAVNRCLVLACAAYFQREERVDEIDNMHGFVQPHLERRLRRRPPFSRLRHISAQRLLSISNRNDNTAAL